MADTAHRPRAGDTKVVETTKKKSARSKSSVKLVTRKSASANTTNDTTDPFACISIGELTRRTKTVYNTTSPVWETGFEFFLPHGKTETVLLEVRDNDTQLMGDEEVICSATLDLSAQEMRPGKTEVVTVELSGGRCGKGAKPTAQVELTWRVGKEQHATPKPPAEAKDGKPKRRVIKKTQSRLDSSLAHGSGQDLEIGWSPDIKHVKARTIGSSNALKSKSKSKGPPRQSSLTRGGHSDTPRGGAKGAALRRSWVQPASNVTALYDVITYRPSNFFGEFEAFAACVPLTSFSFAPRSRPNARGWAGRG